MAHANAPATSDADRLDVAERHSNFVLGTAGWLPKRRFRTAVEKSLEMSDNMLRNTAFGGWWYFTKLLNAASNRDWRHWPHVGLAVDQGGDMISMVMALLLFEPLQACCSIYRTIVLVVVDDWAPPCPSSALECMALYLCEICAGH